LYFYLVIYLSFIYVRWFYLFSTLSSISLLFISNSLKFGIFYFSQPIICLSSLATSFLFFDSFSYKSASRIMEPSQGLTHHDALWDLTGPYCKEGFFLFLFSYFWRISVSTLKNRCCPCLLLHDLDGCMHASRDFNLSVHGFDFEQDRVDGSLSLFFSV